MSKIVCNYYGKNMKGETTIAKEYLMEKKTMLQLAPKLQNV